MEKYKAKVRRAAAEMTGELIFNNSMEHAAVLAERLFASAQDTVCILSGELNARVFGSEEVVEQARLFLAEPSHTLRVLVEDSSKEIREGNPFFEEFFNNPKSNVEFGMVPEDDQDRYDFHMIVADEKCYRFEKNKREPVAVAAFGETAGAETLQAAFDQIWETKTALRN